jgi:two-component system, OmpR family, heavy metal sensor histidine kinase CusS
MNRSIFRKLRNSLGVQLTTWYGVSAFVIVLICTAFLYWWMERTLNYESYRLLENKTQAVRLLIAADRSYATLKRRVEDEWALRGIEKIYVRVLDENNQPITVTPKMEKAAEDVFTRLDSTAHFASTEPLVLQIGRRQYRALTSFMDDPNREGENLKLELILDSTDDSSLLDRYRTKIYFVLGFAFLICLAVGKRIASRGIRPILEITRQSGRIQSTNLYERINIKSLPVELADLAATFNEMLTGLENSFSRLSQFTADIAHELKTPVTNMSGEIEVTLGKTRSVETYQDALGSCLEECGRLSRIIDSLLFLARCENPKMGLKKEKVELGQELADVLEFYEASALEAGIALTLETSPSASPAVLEVERTLFQRAVGNLIANSIKHTASHGTIKVEVAEQPESVRISIEDNGTGIPSEHLPHVFDRFYRVDASRSQDSGGSGLGLAIVKSIAKLHGGAVYIESQLRKGTKVDLIFPIRSSLES